MQEIRAEAREPAQGISNDDPELLIVEKREDLQADPQAAPNGLPDPKTPERDLDARHRIAVEQKQQHDGQQNHEVLPAVFQQSSHRVFPFTIL